MFEKEAKERARDYTENKERQIAYECGFLDGTDRMRAEMQKQGLALQSDMDKTIEQNCVLKKRIEKMKNLEEDNADLKQSLDWANEREKENTERITTLEEEKCELLGIIQGKDKAVKELKEKLAEAERTRDNLIQIGFPTFQSCKEYAELEKENKEAKGLLKKWQQADICDAVVLFADTEEFLKRG